MLHQWICFCMTTWTRTTRTPAFWGYPPPPHDYPHHWVILDPKSKEDKVKVTNLKNSPKFQISKILKQALHGTHLLKLLHKMCKYEMDPMSILEDTERTRFCPQTDRRTRWYQYTPTFIFVEAGGIINWNIWSLTPTWIRINTHYKLGDESMCSFLSFTANFICRLAYFSSLD